MNDRDSFAKPVIDAIAKRASYICSNPNCRAMTLGPSENDPGKVLFVGRAAHISGAAPGGARYDPSLSAEQRRAITNAVFLCSNCADMIDKNGGADFPDSLLRQWKSDHEAWVLKNLNKAMQEDITTVDGVHHAAGIGKVIGLDVREAVFMKPGTKVSAEGIGEITATRVGGTFGKGGRG